ncbi:hypothetical protein MCOR11_000815, partial [Pyricularia oryzae]
CLIAISQRPEELVEVVSLSKKYPEVRERRYRRTVIVTPTYVHMVVQGTLFSVDV